MANRRRLAELGMATPLAAEVATQINSGTAQKAQIAALTPNTVTATTGALPTPDGATTIADADAPTVSELLDFCVENRAKIEAIIAALKA